MTAQQFAEYYALCHSGRSRNADVERKEEDVAEHGEDRLHNRALEGVLATLGLRLQLTRLREPRQSHRASTATVFESAGGKRISARSTSAQDVAPTDHETFLLSERTQSCAA